MFFRMIYDEGLAQAAYLIGCQKTGEAIIIDPERDIDRYIEIAQANRLSIVAAAETHLHADFLSGVREFAERGARAYLSAEGGPDWSYGWPDKKRTDGGAYDCVLLKNKAHFMIGGVRIDIAHTPGHTPEHLCYFVIDLGGGSDEPMGVCTGDFVFAGDLGRPDLLESAAGIEGVARPSAGALFRSTKRFAHWHEHWQVWPGHGAGSACGKSLGAVPSTTVGYELRHNPALAFGDDEPRFVDFILADQPEPPLYFARMKRDNKAGPAVLGKLPAPARVEAADLGDGGAVVVLDTRPWEAFRAGFLRGSLWAPVNNSFCAVAGSYIEEGAPIALVVEPDRLDEAVRRLVRIGLDTVVSWTTPASVEAHRSSGGGVETIEEIPITGVTPGAGVTVIDVRRGAEHAQGSIAGARNIAYTQLPRHLGSIPGGKPLHLHCQGGTRSAHAAAYLKRQGHEVVNLGGGFGAWERAGRPVEAHVAERADRADRAKRVGQS
jgi:hydroxyacylglutathione hydrolase